VSTAAVVDKVRKMEPMKIFHCHVEAENKAAIDEALMRKTSRLRTNNRIIISMLSLSISFYTCCA
jgi:hypothetical protein